MSAALQDAATAMQDVDCPSLFWVAVCLVQLEWGGHEEGGWSFEEKGLVTASDVYAGLGVMPACRLSEADAETVAAEMRTGLAAVNEGRPPLSSTLSRGLYDVRVAGTNTLPRCISDLPPRYRPAWSFQAASPPDSVPSPPTIIIREARHSAGLSLVRRAS